MFDQILFWAAAGTLLMTVVVAGSLMRGVRQITRLDEFEPRADFAWPSVSVIVAARNEERNIAEALQSLLHLDYDNLEILVVDDRSTDRTGEILEAMAAEPRYAERLTVRHIADLPPKWLGKNHAHQVGADAARGEWLLFTDADIVMQPSTLRRAVAFAITHEIEHLPMLPAVHVPGFLLQSFVVLFTIYFSAYFKPWKAKDPKSKSHVGIGAFNLVRADTYRAIGGHQPIAMRPDDDVKFGKLVKKHGHRQEVVDGVRLISVEWYASLRELIHGLEKNAFAGVDYRIDILVGSSIVALLGNVWPFLAVFVTHGATQAMYGASVAGLLLLGIATTRGLGVRPYVVLGFPIVMLLFIYIQWRTMILTLATGGIRWRGTHYPLAELKANRV